MSQNKPETTSGNTTVGQVVFNPRIEDDRPIPSATPSPRLQAEIDKEHQQWKNMVVGLLQQILDRLEKLEKREYHPKLRRKPDPFAKMRQHGKE